MGSSRVIATRKCQVYLSHICSECKFPVITVVQITAEAEKTYTLSQSKAEQIADETAQNAIKREIRRIESCRRTKIGLVDTQQTRTMIELGHWYDSIITDFETPCPQCSNIEPWQVSYDLAPKISKHKISELNDDNFPIVFKDFDCADRWAKDYISRFVEELEEKRKDASQVEQAIKNSIISINQIKSYQQQLNLIPELKYCEMFNKQLREYKVKRSQLGLLNFIRKKDINLNIKVLELKLEDVNQIIKDKTNSINFDINREQNILLQNQAIAFGCTNDIVISEHKNTLIYHHKPNDIPENLLMSSHELSTNKISSHNEHDNTPLTQSSGEIAFCRKCGFKLIPDSVFCSKCGKKID